MPAEQHAIATVTQLLDAHKAKAAFLAPTVLALLGTVASWIVSGEFNENEVRTILGGGVTAAVGALATWWTPAGKAEVIVEPGSREV